MTEIPPELRNKYTSFLAHAISLFQSSFKKSDRQVGQKNTYIPESSCFVDDTEAIESSLSKATLVVTTCKLAYSRESIERIELLDQLQTVLIRS